LGRLEGGIWVSTMFRHIVLFFSASIPIRYYVIFNLSFSPCQCIHMMTLFDGTDRKRLCTYIWDPVKGPKPIFDSQSTSNMSFLSVVCSYASVPLFSKLARDCCKSVLSIYSVTWLDLILKSSRKLHVDDSRHVTKRLERTTISANNDRQTFGNTTKSKSRSFQQQGPVSHSLIYRARSYYYMKS
jgi:hypothetical protein